LNLNLQHSPSHMFHIMIIHLLLPHLNHTHVQCKVPSFNMLTLIVGTFCLCHLHNIKHSDLFSLFIVYSTTCVWNNGTMFKWTCSLVTSSIEGWWERWCFCSHVDYYAKEKHLIEHLWAPKGNKIVSNHTKQIHKLGTNMYLEPTKLVTIIYIFTF